MYLLWGGLHIVKCLHLAGSWLASSSCCYLICGALTCYKAIGLGSTEFYRFVYGLLTRLATVAIRYAKFIIWNSTIKNCVRTWVGGCQTCGRCLWPALSVTFRVTLSLFAWALAFRKLENGIESWSHIDLTSGRFWSAGCTLGTALACLAGLSLAHSRCCVRDARRHSAFSTGRAHHDPFKIYNVRTFITLQVK